MIVTIKGASTSIAGGQFAIIGENGEQIASVKAVEVNTSRATNNSYDRNRIAKGDTFDTSVEYITDGDIEAACKAIAANLPQAFKDAKFGTSWFKSDENDFYSCFNFLRALWSQGGWYGNTSAPVVKKIKTAWKNGVQFEI